MDHLSQRVDIDTSRIVVFGRSLGGAVGSVLTKNNPDKVSLKFPSKLCFIFIYLFTYDCAKSFGRVFSPIYHFFFVPPF